MRDGDDGSKASTYTWYGSKMNLNWASSSDSAFRMWACQLEFNLPNSSKVKAEKEQGLAKNKKIKNHGLRHYQKATLM